MVNPALLTLFFKYLTSAQLFFWQVANFSKLMKTMVPWPGSKSSLRIASKMESSNFQSRLDPFFSLLDKFISSSGSQPTAVGIKQFKNRYKAATQRICCSDPKVYMRPVLFRLVATSHFCIFKKLTLEGLTKICSSKTHTSFSIWITTKQNKIIFDDRYRAAHRFLLTKSECDPACWETLI